jgi:CRP/FNR family transcriptional regulator, cyclic AMP receptor protein
MISVIQEERMTGTQDAESMLKSVPIFEGLTKKEIQAVMGSAKEIDYPAGKEIVKEGATGVGFHLILEGEANVIVGDHPQARLGPGDYFGEMSLIDGGPRSATVKADSAVRTLSLASWEFTPLLDTNPSIARKMLVELSRRLRAAERSHTH